MKPKENSLYHIKPNDMKGDTLYPLNCLKNIYPRKYKKEVKKYQDRKFVTEYKIPTLNCLWNDVLHLVTVPPSKIKNAYEQAGGDISTLEWYKIDLNQIDVENTAVYLYSQKDKENVLVANDFEPFDPKKIDTYKKIPKETINYYKKKISNNEKPLLFHGIPHILYKGTIDVSRSEVTV